MESLALLGRDELLYLLCNHLNTAPLAIVALSFTCRALRDVAFDDGLWRQLLAASFWDAGLSPLGIPALRWTEEEEDSPEQSIRAARALSARQLFGRFFKPVGRNAAALHSLSSTPVPAGLWSLLRGNRQQNLPENKASVAPASLCQLCGDTLRRLDSHYGRRCPCIAARGAQLPLRLFSLSPGRSGGSSLDTLATFSEMRATLGELFELSVVTADRIEPDSLCDVDMVILCTTEGEGLSGEEQTELHRYVYGGGTAIVSAFANWSAHHHYNIALTSWLGVESTEGADFGQRQEYCLEESVPQWLRCRSVWGSANHVHFVNTGETPFRLLAGEGTSGGIPLHGSVDATTLAFFPRLDALGSQAEHDQVPQGCGTAAPSSNQRPRTVALNVRVPNGAQPGMTLQLQAQFGVVNVVVPDGATAGQVIRIRVPLPPGQSAPVVPPPSARTPRMGQVLVLSNLHCLANRDAWNGGHWMEEPGNRALLLDLVSDAIAWRRRDTSMKVVQPEPEPQ
jgi:hypothetical protein